MCMRQQGKSGTATWHGSMRQQGTCAREGPAQGHEQGMTRKWTNTARGAQGHDLHEGCAMLRLARGVRKDIAS